MIKQFGIFIILIAILFSTGCGGGCQRKPIDDDFGVDSTADTTTHQITDNQIREIISSIPNPVEMSSLLEKSGVIFSQKLLNPTKNLKNYSENNKKALNLGIYGADLVHMNIYDRTVAAILYVSILKDLANDLKLGQFFDSATLLRLSENEKNVDSVLYITSSGFDRMTHFLITEKRAKHAILISYGTWIETLYLATNIEKVINSKDVYTRIGDQKDVVNNIVLLLGAYKDKDKDCKMLYEDALLLKKEFDKVIITRTYAPPTFTEVNGIRVVTDNSTSSSNIDENMVKQIGKVVNTIRTKIIN